MLIWVPTWICPCIFSLQIYYQRLLLFVCWLCSCIVCVELYQLLIVIVSKYYIFHMISFGFKSRIESFQLILSWPYILANTVVIVCLLYFCTVFVKLYQLPVLIMITPYTIYFVYFVLSDILQKSIVPLIHTLYVIA